MTEIKITIYRDGKIETSQDEYKKVYSNECGYSVYEDCILKNIIVFDVDKKGGFHQGLEEVYTIDWLSDSYFNFIKFGIYTEKKVSTSLNKLKRHIKKYFDKHYGFINNIDYDKITL